MNWLNVLLVVGASHSLLSLIGVVSALSMPPPNSISQQPHHERKMGNLPMVLKSWERNDRIKDRMENEKEKDKVYDFIVVGAGTSGSIVAARLSKASFSVLLLEAGGTPHINHDNPAMSMIMAKHPENDWMYSSVVQNEACLLCPEKKYIFSAGKGLGGSGNLNYLDTLHEGKFQDYNEWMEATQDPGWGLFMLQTYFKTVKGYMKKKYAASNGESPYYRSTYKALIKTTPKLEVQKYSTVHRILIDESGRAKGVEYERHGSIKYANASKEIIISAGTFGSPKILMLSGIGPAKILSSHNITVRADLPVGKNFQDHLAIPVGPFFKSVEQSSAGKNRTMSVIHDAWNSSTILRMPLINLNYQVYSKEMAHFFSINETTLKDYISASSQSKNSTFGAANPNSMFINVALKKPMSKGKVFIAGSDPKLKPIVDPNFLLEMNHIDHQLAHSSEKQLLIDALEETVKLMEVNPTFKAKFTDVPFPGCEDYIFRGMGFWDCYISHFSITLNHGSGTCAMGSSKSTIPAVVSPELKVYGVEGLRVIDASVMPTIVGTFPYQSVAVIAEKGADMIEKRYTFEEYLTPEHSLSPRSSNVDPGKIEHNQADKNSNSDGFSFFSGFRIKKVAIPEVSTVAAPLSNALTKFWKRTDQLIQQAYSHTAGTSLNDDDLTPPGEEQNENLNPSNFPVKPLAAKLIFHPLVPEQSPLVQNDFQRNEKPAGFDLSTFFKNLFSFAQPQTTLVAPATGS